jgi:alkanesulfonate monooxygenase SsuD/methylene tetrahydromethanopterin reductase-like flavin-dependent oxidoreductase (luciferase family)
MVTKMRDRKTDECLEIIRRLWRKESVDVGGVLPDLDRWPTLIRQLGS